MSIGACVSRRLYSTPAKLEQVQAGDMNRLREIRERAGLTQEQLGEMVGATSTQIWRLETGRSQLTQYWLTVLAEQLGCHPADIIANVVGAEVEADVEAYAGADRTIANAIAARGLKVYRVIGRSLLLLGIEPGQIITVDESEAAAATPKLGDVVLVEVGPERAKVLRQFLPPSSLVTNRKGAGLVINLDDPTVTPRIVGVVLRDDRAALA